jgi:hypothetical protein
MTPSTPQLPKNQFVIVPHSDQYPSQLFCDGVTGFSIGAANCKLDLHQVLGVDERGEIRKIVQSLVMPTASLVDLCHFVLEHFSQNSAALRAALEEQEQKIVGKASTGDVKGTKA